MSPATRRIASLVATGLVAIVLVACSGASTAPPPGGGPTAAPSHAPTPAPTDVPARPAPSDGGTSAITVDLQNVTGADVSVDVVDRSGTLVNARSGRPADGASVEADSIKVENIDPRTLRLTWTDFPIDNRLTLYIDAQGVGFRFLLIQPEPTGPTDAIGVDRILELTFDHDISSAQVESIVQGGLDTSD
jgi:hypothetical protein